MTAPSARSTRVSQVPRVALVLGGGGARGIAHIGVLRALEQANVPITFIAGTSIGAVIGGVYADAVSADFCEQGFRAFVKSDAYFASGLANLQGMGKPQENMLRDLLAGIKRKIFLAMALSKPYLASREKLDLILKSFVRDVPIESLKIPFVAAATDFNSGDTVLFNSGSLLSAVRASVSLAGIFPPVEYGSMKLVDGRASASVPTVALDRQEFDLSIAVDASIGVNPDESPANVLDMILRQGDIVDFNLKEKLLQEVDVVVRPSVNDVRWTEFDKVDQLIEAGLKAGKEALPEIQKLLASRAATHLYGHRRRQRCRTMGWDHIHAGLSGRDAAASGSVAASKPDSDSALVVQTIVEEDFPGAPPGTGHQTIPSLLLSSFERNHPKRAFFHKVQGRWEKVAGSDFRQAVQEVALGLYHRGIRSGDKVAIFGASSPYWNICDLAVLSLGGVTVPIYPNTHPDQVRYILDHARAKLIFVGNDSLWEVLKPIVETLETKPATVDLTFPIIGVGSLVELGDDGHTLAVRKPHLFSALRQAVRPDDLATIIYTSGTTGTPKGVMLSQGNLAANLLAIAQALPLEADSDVALSFLPLSHAFERIVSLYYMYIGVPIYYSTTMNELSADIKSVRPTVMSAVPRLLEKVYERFKSAVAGLPAMKRRIYQDSLDLSATWRPGHEGFANRIHRWVVDKLVYRHWREAMGGRLKMVVCGGAALDTTVSSAFTAAGIPVYQGYGLSEASPVISANTPTHNNIFSVGRPLPGVQVKLAEDGEILVHGPNVMMGYYRDEKATAETIAGGWLKTGDIGKIDADGYISITDRKKELIKTSGGKFIAPAPIEEMLKRSPFIEEAVVVGNNRKFAAALVVVNREFLARYIQHKGLKTTVADLLKSPELFARLKASIGKINTLLPRHEQIKRFAILDQPFTIERGELTPTLKVRRRFVAEHYKDVIESLYVEGEPEPVRDVA
ncbi:MAG TPA: AMP-binding protein [Planctomycetota bacterium]|nr:AMP-binding protein [Planctomycetota bacterium]